LSKNGGISCNNNRKDIRRILKIYIIIKTIKTENNLFIIEYTL